MILPGTPLARPANLSAQVLSPTAAEIAATRVLFLARHATDTSAERQKKYGYFVTYNAAVLRALREMGLDVTPASDLDVLFGPLDFGFIYSIHHHETFEGHELLASAVAAYRGVPCLGGAAPMRAVAEDKVLAKRLAASLGIEVADHRLVDPHDPAAVDQAPAGRWILKPRSGVASDTVLRGDGKTDWKKMLAAAAHPKHRGRAFIAESFVPGLNLTVPVVEGFPARSFDVFEEKGRPGDNILTPEGKEGRKPEYAAEPYLGPGAEAASAAAEKLAAELSPFDYARFDFRYDPESRRLVFLEVNLACNLAPAAVVARAAKLRGVSYPALLGHVFAYSLRRQQRR
jgi:D-alanine-D-alanine ligase